MTETALTVATPQRQSLRGFTPHNAKELAWLASEVVKSGLFKVGPRVMSGSEAFVVMMKGAELGLTPMQSLAEISLIKGRPFVSKDVVTARITRSPRCKHWDPSDADATHCTIRFQVVGEQPAQLTTRIENIPKRYFAPSSTGEPSNWTLIPEDMLFAWTARRVARRWFPEAMLDIGDARADEIDEAHVIDVAAVERITAPDNGVYGQHVGCGGNLYLHANTKGGAYLQCEKCGERSSPPQEVRDAIRGTPEALTVAAQELAPGERAMSDEEAAQYMQQVAPPEPDTSEPGTPDTPPDGAVSAEAGEDAPSPSPEEPAAEVAVDAASNAAGFSIADVPAPVVDTRSYAVRWLVAGQQRVLAHIQEARTWQGKAKTDVRDALLEAGWIGTPDTLVAFVEGRSPVELAELLDTFRLKVNIAIDNAEEAQ